MDLLKEKCPVVYSAASEKFKEGQDGAYQFEDVDEATLLRFVHWAYTSDYAVENTMADASSTLATTTSSTVAANTQVNNHLINPVIFHARVYIFASTYLIEDFKEVVRPKIVDNMFSDGTKVPRIHISQVIELLSLASDNLQSDDSLLDFLGKYAARKIVQFRSAPAFIEILPKVAGAIVKYVLPYDGALR